MRFGFGVNDLEISLQEKTSEVEKLTKDLKKATDYEADLKTHIRFIVEQNLEVAKILDVTGVGRGIRFFTYELGEAIKINNKFFELKNKNLDNKHTDENKDKEEKILVNQYIAEISQIFEKSNTLNQSALSVTDIVKEIQTYTRALSISSSKRHDTVEKYAQLIEKENPEVSKELRRILILNTQLNTRLQANLQIIRTGFIRTINFRNVELGNLGNIFEHIKSNIARQEKEIVNSSRKSSNLQEVMTHFTKYSAGYFKDLSTLAEDIVIVQNMLPKDVKKSIDELEELRTIELALIQKIKAQKIFMKRFELEKIKIKKEMIRHYTHLRKLGKDLENCRNILNLNISDSSLKIKPFLEYTSEQEILDFADKFEKVLDWVHPQISNYDDVLKIIRKVFALNNEYADEFSNIRVLINKTEAELYDNYGAYKQSMSFTALEEITKLEKKFKLHSKKTQVYENNEFNPPTAVLWVILLGSKFDRGDSNNKGKEFTVFSIPDDVEEFVESNIFSLTNK